MGAGVIRDGVDRSPLLHVLRILLVVVLVHCLYFQGKLPRKLAS